jgi:CRISPR-associated protein Cas1
MLIRLEDPPFSIGSSRAYVEGMRGAEPAKPTELGRLSDRLSYIYVEHTPVDRNHNAVRFLKGGGEVQVPVAQLAALLCGPGTTVTHAAAVLMATNGCTVAWVGEEGVRLYAGAVSLVRSSSLLQRQAALVSDPETRLAVARKMYEMRFPGEDVSGMTMQQLRGREGARVRECYREHSERTGVAWKRRAYLPGKWQASDPVNRALSTANSCLYGVAHAATLHLGCSPGLGFVHTGHQLSFLYDLADLRKAQTSIPAAFDAVAQGGPDQDSRVRKAMRDRIVEARLLEAFAADIKTLLGAGTSGNADEPVDGFLLGKLWDNLDGLVRSGVNHEGAVQW